jgi:hypothetical protein
MPTLLRKNGFRFFFYSREGHEPPHVHVIGRGGEMKVWLQPVKIARHFGLSAHDRRDVLQIMMENIKFFRDKWREWHERDR